MPTLVGSQLSAPNNNDPLSLPAGVLADDLAVLYVGFNDSGAPADPSWAGYTKAREHTAGGNSIQIWYRRLDGTSADTPNLATGETEIAVIAAAWRGPFDWADLLGPVNGAYHSATTSIALSEVTTLKRALLVFGATNDGAATYSAWDFANAVSEAEIAEHNDGATRIGAAYGLLNAIGPSGAGSVTQSASQDGTHAVVALNLSPHAFFDLTNTPGDFGTADSASIEVRAKTQDLPAPLYAAPATSSSSDTEGTNHTVNLPSGIQEGDRLVAFFVNDDSDTPTFPAGWSLVSSEVIAGGDTYRLSIYSKTAGASEPASISVTTPSSELSSAVVYRVSGGGDVSAATIAEQNTTNPNPPLLGLTGSFPRLWFAVAADGARDQSVSSYPASYTNGVYADSGSGGLSSAHANVAVATRELTAASEDPGTFTMGLTQPTLVTTVAVSPKPLKLFVRIFESDEFTPLSGEVEVASISVDGAFTNYTATITGINTSANKATWDAARIRFRWGT